MDGGSGTGVICTTILMGSPPPVANGFPTPTGNKKQTENTRLITLSLSCAFMIVPMSSYDFTLDGRGARRDGFTVYANIV